MMQTAKEDAAATVLELEAKRLEVTKRRHQMQLSQMVSFEMERKQMQARHMHRGHPSHMNDVSGANLLTRLLASW